MFRVLFAALLVVIIAGCQGYQENSKARTPGEYADDVAIHSIVKAKYIADPDIGGLSINIDVRKGIVFLYGPVPSEPVRTKALNLAKGLKGVKEVVDHLTVMQARP